MKLTTSNEKHPFDSKEFGAYMSNEKFYSTFGGQLKNYREQVLRAAKLRDGSPVYNGSLEHAAVLTENLVKFAENELCVLSGNLNPKVFGNPHVLSRTAEFLGKTDRKIRILVEDPNSIDFDDHPLIMRFATSDDLEIRVLDAEVSGDIEFHFAVADCDSYRFEQDKNKFHAIGAFGDREGAEHLQGIFEDLWKISNKQNLN